MNRRELLKQIALLTGGVVIGGEVFLSGCKSPGKEVGFTETNIALLDEVGETILPATSTPGAKAARIGQFMKTIVNDCYTENQQAVFTNGMQQLGDECKKATGKTFLECSAQERHNFLLTLEKEAKEYNDKIEAEDKPKREKVKEENKKLDWKNHKEFEGTPSHYYTMMKQLTLWGYFTSKEGMTKALDYQPVPGKYVGCIDYKQGDKKQVGLGG